MPILEVKEKRKGRASAQGQDWRRTYTRIFQVLTTPDVGPLKVRTSVGLAIGDIYSFGSESDTGAFVDAIEAVCDDDSSKSWTVTVQYGPWDPNVFPLNPIEEQPRVSWGWAQFQEAVTKDRDGSPIQNTAHLPFNPSRMRDQSRPILAISRNQSTFDLDLADSLRDTVNNATWWGADAGKVKISNISGTRLYNADAGGYFWEVQYEFQFNRMGWADRPLNAGLMQFNASGTKWEKIYHNGSEVSEPFPLSESGHALAKGDDPFYLEFDIYEESDFSLLNFDDLYTELTS